MGTARAAVMNGINEPFEVKSFELVAPPPGMAQIRLIASGICGTDIHIHKGKIPIRTPAIIGHEFVGEVMALAPADSRSSGIQAGDRVIVYIACPCGDCLLCRSGDEANCVSMGVTNSGDPAVAPHLYGGYAEYNYSPVANLIKIPAPLDAVMAGIFACAGPTALHAFQLASRANCALENAKVAVVQGLGPVGLFAVLYLSSLGIEHILAITGRKKPERDQRALRLGATGIFSLDCAAPDEISRQVLALSGGLGADLVIEASGNPDAVAQGMDLLRNRGVYLVPGQYSNSGKTEISPQLITFKALQIIGSSQYAAADVTAYLDFLQKNPQLQAMILSLAAKYPVTEINQAIADAKAGQNIKTLLVPG